MVCDLQGVYSKNKFILTDPAINSIKQIYGNTDISCDGIESIISRHKCNKICRDFGLHQ
jgi:hypothetical protein